VADEPGKPSASIDQACRLVLRAAFLRAPSFVRGGQYSHSLTSKVVIHQI
jgi:hypothetical protein